MRVYVYSGYGHSQNAPLHQHPPLLLSLVHELCPCKLCPTSSSSEGWDEIRSEKEGGGCAAVFSHSLICQETPTYILLVSFCNYAEQNGADTQKSKFF